MKIYPSANKLYYGDCLDIMEQFSDESIDLICLDPPFNSNKKYGTIFKGSGMNITPQLKAFTDTWIWNDRSEERVERIKSAHANPASKVIKGFDEFIPRSKILSYTSYMAERLYHMHRILKPTGSIYLHCDQYANHYLRLVMDAIFGEKNFRNEIVWCYTGPSNTKRWFPRKHDNLLFYAKSDQATFNKDAIRIPYKSLNTQHKEQQNSGIGGNLTPKNVESYRNKGKIPEDYWLEDRDKMSPVGRIPSEYIGYSTQKPIALYERMIKASSNKEDIILDPFCGCGTTIDAALKNQRRAIGIDILPYALTLINQRRLGVPLPIEGIPVDMETVEQLIKMPKGAEIFQDWAISLIDGLASNQKKTNDKGIDGFGMFAHKPDNMNRKGIIVQVTAAKGSQLNKFDKLQTDVRKHNAAMGILITKDMQHAQENWDVTLQPIQFGIDKYNPMQCFSIEEYYRNGEQHSPPLKLPPLTNPWTGKPMQETLFQS